MVCLVGEEKKQGCFIIATSMKACSSIRKFYQFQKLSDQQEREKLARNESIFCL